MTGVGSKPDLASMLRSTLTLRRGVVIAALTLAWCGLWQTISFANVASGLALSFVVLASGVGTPGQGGIKPLEMIKLLKLIMVDLVTSTVSVAVEVITPTDRSEEAVIAVDVPSYSRHHFLLLIVAITLTPGTAVVDADPNTGPNTATLYLHVLHVKRRSETEAHVKELSRLAEAAFPTTSQAASETSIGAAQ